MAKKLTEFAAKQQRRFDTTTSPEERKERGHFGTPPAIAEFMAEMFSQIPKGIVRILDPGAGVGTLSAAICQRIQKLKSPRHLVFELWENDPSLVPLLIKTMNHCRKELKEFGHDLEYAIRIDDFILANTRKSLFHAGPDTSFHFAILNPPYFKLRKESPQAQAMEHVVYGQPNIYALFMAVACDLLTQGGEMAAITPRSYFNGPYFKRFRKWFFDRMSSHQIHLFESRTEAFSGDAVLQESVILLAEKGGAQKDMALTTSVGQDLTKVEKDYVAYEKVFDNCNGDHVIRVSTNKLEHDIIEAMDDLPERFRSLDFDISTGPVVTFRSREFLRHERATNTAPLLWMHNVRPFITQFPVRNGKPTHILVNEESKRLLVPAKTYVLFKRFTAKEEKRRLVAGIMSRKDSYSEWIGLENHLNYVYRKGSELSETQAYGLAAFFNSALVDLYFRAISGNTQVNATEIRVMPMPDEIILMKIGEETQMIETKNLGAVERIVGEALRLPRKMINQLIEVAQ